MKKISSILLLGALSMLFAEVFSGASQAWFLDPFGVLLTFGLYLAHCLFFLWIALRTKKTSLSQLYILGMAFGLYEAVITKVLWAGYMDATGPGFGTVLGVASVEFLVLVFFWHPIFSFIFPILTYEVITGENLITHDSVLKKTKRKTNLLLLGLFAVSIFVANGNKLNLASAWLSVIGNTLLVFIFGFLGKKRSIRQFNFKGKYFALACVYLFALYAWSGFNILPERFPKEFCPYLTIILSYLYVGLLFTKSKKNSVKLIAADKASYGIRDLLKFSLILFVFVTISCLTPEMVNLFLPIIYLGMALGGILIFIKSSWQIFVKQKNMQTTEILE